MKQQDNKLTPPLKTAVRTTIEQHILSDKHINTFLTQQSSVLNNGSSAAPLKRSSYRTSKLWALAVAGALIMVMSFWLTQPNDYSEDIAAEVVKNHLKLKPLDIEASSLTDIRAFFTALDFSPVDSSFIHQAKLLTDVHLIGGRYCSIKGMTAAQFRYQRLDNQHDASTLYQVQYNPDLYGVIPDMKAANSPKVIIMKGLEVSLWVERGLLMVLVSD